MQFMALYREASETGVYFAMHDPWGSTKKIVAKIGSPEQGVELGFKHPVPDMGRAGNRFELSGSGVWGLLQGDWFDASIMYRDWVRREARWYPKLSRQGREDTPLWMRELCLWAMGGGEPQPFAALNRQLCDSMGVPTAVHWYRWHQIPFDNDYPHYFPAVPGFTEATSDLQKHNVSVMPYINGRLWDTRDRKSDDFEFTKYGQPAASKDESGQPYVEMYGSKESDGSRVELAVMCPATQLWQDRVRDIVLRLTNECGVRGVYIDQVAAAQPTLCFDASHGHPLGGGHWWTESYWQMLESIRRQLPDQRMLTTECNAEPYIHCFDGYLTWHWQYDGQVPAFPAVYGGAIQMFGRAYRGGPTKDLAFRMKAAQQMVFGEQLGWMDPRVVNEPENARFLRQLVQLRYRFRDYFYKGEMARPPRLDGAIPRVEADWQWQGTWPVTTDAVLTGAWKIPRENRTLLMLVNVSDQSVSLTPRLDMRDYFSQSAKLVVSPFDPTGERELPGTWETLHRGMEIPARAAIAWEITGL